MTANSGAWLDSRPAAVVLDCDGLLMDTEKCWTIAERSLFERRGLTFGPEQKAALIGKSLDDTAAALKVLLGDPQDTGRIAVELLDAVEAAMLDDCAPMPGAAAFLAAIPDDVTVCVASNSPRRLLEQAIAKGGFDRSFAFLMSCEDVSRPKPFPDIYLEASARLGADPARCVAFEDSVTGCRAAMDAGLYVVGVPYLKDSTLPAHTLFTSLEASALIGAVAAWRGPRQAVT